MGTHLQQILKTLCFNTGWNYAVFWKLKHGARMVLTWEDAYYDNHGQLGPTENMCSIESGSNLGNRDSHDPLGSSLAKMSYLEYSLGEGIIGQVAATGKHFWIVSDKDTLASYVPLEHCDGWQTQFLAGIKTVVVVAIVPHGVVQLGSLNEITEDLMLVSRIKDTFFAVQNPTVQCNPTIVPSRMKNLSCLSDIPTSSGSGKFHNSISNFGKQLNRSPASLLTEDLADCCYIVPPNLLLKKAVEEVGKGQILEQSVSLESRSEKGVQTSFHNDRTCAEETSCSGYQGVQDHDNPSSYNYLDKTNLCTLQVDATSLKPYFDSTTSTDQSGMLNFQEPPNVQSPDVMRNIDFQAFSSLEPLDIPLKFSAGCELYEVLGPAFQKQTSYSDWEAGKSTTEVASEMPERMCTSKLLTGDSGSEHLLEAVVANVCRSETDVKIESEPSHFKSGNSLVTTEKMPLVMASTGYSFDQSLGEKESSQCLSSEGYGISSSMGFSSRSHSAYSEQFENSQEPAKMNKKRARPGENNRPRPRDRQLIQDRIKELRELVPSGAKCSIDSLLERTIKHMLFMQSITKHADKLNKYPEPKLHDKEVVTGGFPSCDQGSSWAMEVGSHLKVCAIMVENININGQMQIKMLCEECSHFLEIAEAIRSLGLTILKGVTEACDQKTWMLFIVEGQNNRGVHRMDILWSLVQILQSKTTTTTI